MQRGVILIRLCINTMVEEASILIICKHIFYAKLDLEIKKGNFSVLLLLKAGNQCCLIGLVMGNQQNRYWLLQQQNIVPYTCISKSHNQLIFSLYYPILFISTNLSENETILIQYTKIINSISCYYFLTGEVLYTSTDAHTYKSFPQFHVNHMISTNLQNSLYTQIIYLLLLQKHNLPENQNI